MLFATIVLPGQAQTACDAVAQHNAPGSVYTYNMPARGQARKKYSTHSLAIDNRTGAVLARGAICSAQPMRDQVAREQLW